MLPILPQNALNTTFPSPKGLQFPRNVAADLPEELRTKMMRWLYSNYVLPQMMERRQYEFLWDELHEMYRVKLKTDKLRYPRTQAAESIQDRQAENLAGDNSAGQSQVSDTVVYDAVDRLKNLNHFVSWKDGTPIKYQMPITKNLGAEDQFYFPTAQKIESFNGLLDWNIKNQDVYRKHLILAQHHYLYGICFVASDFSFSAEPVQRQNNQGQMMQRSEVTEIGITFDPISLRRIWLNYRQPVYEMNYQQCPFYFEQMPRYAILQNQYDPQSNPFGYVNLDKLSAGQWMFSAPEMEEARKAMAQRAEDAAGYSLSGGWGSGTINNLSEVLFPQYSVEALWTFHCMLPFDEETMEFETCADGTPIPMVRYIWQSFANNLLAGQILPIRIQKNFYPRGELPLYGSSHMPDLDAGLYSPAIGEVLENHYKEICTAMNQYVDNKNLINTPPSWYVIGSPSSNMNRNQAGADLPVNSPNDVGWRQVYDGTGTTVNMIDFLRNQAQTSSKAVDAILGKALGGRTSATEATNVFQAAMSGVTTDINLFNYDIMGGYASRVWEYTGLWFNPELLKAITGMYGAQLEPEDLWTRIELKWDVGSSFIETIVKQGNIRYALEAAVNSPVLDQAILWRELFTEFRMPECIEAIRDGGFSANVQESTEQAIDTYMGNMIIIDPTQDHNIAIEVKTRFLKDRDSKWNTEYGALPSPAPNMRGQMQSRVQYLAEQIAMHQQFVMIQMQQQLAQQQMAIAAEAKQKGGPVQLPKTNAPENPAQVRQAQGS